jgi:hypothetical protein
MEEPEELSYAAMICWCGHRRDEHGPGDVEGYYRPDLCQKCGGKKCDEFQTFSAPNYEL